MKEVFLDKKLYEALEREARRQNLTVDELTVKIIRDRV